MCWKTAVWAGRMSSKPASDRPALTPRTTSWRTSRTRIPTFGRSWSVDNNARTLTMHGVNIIGNAETVDITVPLPATGGQYGHSNSMTLTYVSGAPIISGTFPAQVQLAP